MKTLTRIALSSFALVGASAVLNAQTFFSNSATVYALPGSIVQVNGGMTLSGASTLSNEGTITVATTMTNPGTFTINGTSSAMGSGTYRIEQDWINNAVFTCNNSNVMLFGNTQQFIGGSVMTTFHNLQLTGTGSNNNRKKSLLAINASINGSGILAINDRELDTDVNTIFVQNTSTAAVTNSVSPGSEGFVSSLGNGCMSRQTNSVSSYLFPTGSSLGTTRYRPVILSPANALMNTYTGRLANNDATLDLCPIVNRPPAIGSLNPLFYHKIRRTVGTARADVQIVFNPSADGDNFDAMAQWGVPAAATWNDLGIVAPATTSVTKGSWGNFSFDEFILGSKIENPVIIPNIFSPDGDGINDFFTITDAGFDVFSIEIYDRWGVKLFETSAAQIVWDGRTTAGVAVVDGTYFYILKAVTKKTKTDYSRTGFVTLVRKN